MAPNEYPRSKAKAEQGDKTVCIILEALSMKPGDEYPEGYEEVEFEIMEDDEFDDEFDDEEE